jgi:hypothetical protein
VRAWIFILVLQNMILLAMFISKVWPPIMHIARRDFIAVAGTSAVAMSIPGCASLKAKTNYCGNIQRE